MPAPKNAKQPTDRQAKAEAKSQFIELDYEGKHYTIDRENADNLELMEFTEDGQYIKAIRGYLGIDQWNAWKDARRDDKGRVTTQEFESFLNAVMEAIGGNS